MDMEGIEDVFTNKMYYPALYKLNNKAERNFIVIKIFWNIYKSISIVFRLILEALCIWLSIDFVKYCSIRFSQ